MAKKKRSAGAALRASRPLQRNEMRDLKRGLQASPPGKPVPLSTRVAPDVLDGLRRALADRLVSRQERRDQQSIVTAALRAWLTESGYMGKTR
ncbi:MAG: hypothetical protein ACYSVY_18460 [Planctomycetota bacterium]|jgi:hypothetical protein